MDLYDDLVSSARGRAPLPRPAPPVMESFKAMHGSSKQICGCEWANLDDVYTYLRNNRNLKIPDHWKRFVPKEPPR